MGQDISNEHDSIYAIQQIPSSNNVNSCGKVKKNRITLFIPYLKESDEEVVKNICSNYHSLTKLTFKLKNKNGQNQSKKCTIKFDEKNEGLKAFCALTARIKHIYVEWCGDCVFDSEERVCIEIQSHLNGKEIESLVCKYQSFHRIESKGKYIHYVYFTNTSDTLKAFIDLRTKKKRNEIKLDIKLIDIEAMDGDDVGGSCEEDEEGREEDYSEYQMKKKKQKIYIILFPFIESKTDENIIRNVCKNYPSFIKLFVRKKNRKSLQPSKIGNADFTDRNEALKALHDVSKAFDKYIDIEWGGSNPFLSDSHSGDDIKLEEGEKVSIEIEDTLKDINFTKLESIIKKYPSFSEIKNEVINNEVVYKVYFTNNSDTIKAFADLSKRRINGKRFHIRLVDNNKSYNRKTDEYVNSVKMTYNGDIISKEEIIRIFSIFGKITKLSEIYQYRDSKYFIITYDSQEAVEKVMELVNGVENIIKIDNKPTTITFFVSKNCLINISFPHLKLSNLPPITTEFILYDMLKEYNLNILSLFIARDKRNKRMGIAEIEFESEKDCKKCFREMKGKIIGSYVVDAKIM